MTTSDVTYGCDVSNHQPGFSIAAAVTQGYDFFMAKCTEGTDYADPYYNGFRADAQAAKTLFAAYHVLHRGKAKAQANWLAQHIGDKRIPAMLDVEPMPNSRPTLNDVIVFLAQAHALGLTVSLDYLPEWYWEQIGKPSLKKLPAEVQSFYASSRHDHGSALYPGNKSTGWSPFGGVTPTILQFASTGLIDGYNGNVDLNAFRGTKDELVALKLFKDYGAPRKHQKHETPVHPHHWHWLAIHRLAMIIRLRKQIRRLERKSK